jgi:hypothetical protein
MWFMLARTLARQLVLPVRTLHRRNVPRSRHPGAAAIQRRPNDRAEIDVAGRRPQVDMVVSAGGVGPGIDGVPGDPEILRSV